MAFVSSNFRKQVLHGSGHLATMPAEDLESCTPYTAGYFMTPQKIAPPPGLECFSEGALGFEQLSQSDDGDKFDWSRSTTGSQDSSVQDLYDNSQESNSGLDMTAPADQPFQTSFLQSLNHLPYDDQQAVLQRLIELNMGTSTPTMANQKLGGPSPTKMVKKFCTQCGAKRMPGHMFCPHCGEHLC
mmetsp:Transcript_61861/g.109888  ORF Transcript_61861/g.109888 Transcript_61861/m.109888 type:complete len:186 (+) Transcript_61861:78-635(+)